MANRLKDPNRRKNSYMFRGAALAFMMMALLFGFISLFFFIKKDDGNGYLYLAIGAVFFVLGMIKQYRKK